MDENEEDLKTAIRVPETARRGHSFVSQMMVGMAAEQGERWKIQTAFISIDPKLRIRPTADSSLTENAMAFARSFHILSHTLKNMQL